ncbi:MAG: hypothetical protein WAW85_11995 [Gordonia sp. (in: high G+C Gram-positive bacteria)]|uniref:hypothetical protein n=1 Tax=Gordonia sp. (in: high G+C Gram-positive bacteria) TaxID=84139 RepID=UPI003BB5ECD7
MGASKSENDDTGMFIVWGILLLIAFLAVAWPYFFGTWLAVNMGAENPSTARTATGWVFETLWLVGIAGLAGWAWISSEREQEEKRRRELAERQREADFGPEGLRLFTQAEAAIARIAESEAAQSGWLGNAAEFDFSADLAAIADNLRRSQQIRNVTADAASIKSFNESDTQMLDDAQRAASALDDSVKQRVALIEGCAHEASDIDRVLQDEREDVEMEKRREELRDRLNPILYSAGAPPTENPSAAADGVTARVSAFHELKALIGSHRTAE